MKPKSSPRLLDRMRFAMRAGRYSPYTEKAYVGWVRRYILFHGKRHPIQMGNDEVGEFLSYLAVNRKVAPSTQNQALSAILFLYKRVLDVDPGWISGVTRAKRRRRLPLILTPPEVKAILSHLSGRTWLMANILYGGGLRVMECCRLRVKDLDLQLGQITVRGGRATKTALRCFPRWSCLIFSVSLSRRAGFGKTIFVTA